VQASLDYKQRLQQMFFPEGIAYDGNRFNRTAATATFKYLRFYRLQLPSYLGFFAGKRSVPIITAFAVIVVGALLSLVWPPIGGGIDRFSHWAVHTRPALAFTIYGVVERP
jgi:phosphotransferase system  glucose/maltose/N-acetylglucosamine-specific IIC component